MITKFSAIADLFAYFHRNCKGHKKLLTIGDCGRKNLSNNIQFDLFITKTFKTNKTFLYAPLNLATARFMPAFRLFQLTSLVLGLKTCCCLFFPFNQKKCIFALGFRLKNVQVMPFIRLKNVQDIVIIRLKNVQYHV